LGSHALADSKGRAEGPWPKDARGLRWAASGAAHSARFERGRVALSARLRVAPAFALRDYGGQVATATADSLRKIESEGW
jgi:hypothetical protein